MILALEKARGTEPALHIKMIGMQVGEATRRTGKSRREEGNDAMMKNQMKLLIGDDVPRLGENRATTLELR